MSESDSKAEESTEESSEEEIDVDDPFDERIQGCIESFKQEVEDDSEVIYFGTFQDSINGKLVHEFHKFIRQQASFNELNIILESGGGQLDASVKLVNICEQYSDVFNVYVPFYAKSAATVIALSAHELYLGRAGELGPVDPQISHPLENDMMIQALSIRDAIDFIENDISDDTIKSQLIDQLDTYWIGASQRAIDQSREYLKDVARGADQDKVIQLVEDYKDHGYPIDRSRCDELGIHTRNENRDIEDTLYDVHDAAVEMYDQQNLRYIISNETTTTKESANLSLPEGLSDELEDIISDGNIGG